MPNLGSGPALVCIKADLPTPVVVGRAPFADVFDVAKAPQTDFLLVKPTQADAR
ncbi:hypothetical protein PSA5_09265 [Pseudomonas syringae pv. actinidiae]|nr:hypothetical protein PSA5_09265 [Pseudomonas syringae pv. actinidiae]